MEQIITSLLDTDLYKISMMQCVFHQYPDTTVRYEFKCRNDDVELGFLRKEIQKQALAMDGMRFTKGECDYLRTLPFLTDDYVDWLENDFALDSNNVNVDEEDGHLYITIGGYWAETILWEVPLLAIVNELYFATRIDDFKAIRYGRLKLYDKIQLMRKRPRMLIAEFGTRRRFSKDWQREVVHTLANDAPNLIGTSNVLLAKELGLKPIGTMAHEYISAHLSLVDNIETAQKRALHVWLQEYGTDLGIALTDTFTSDAFFRDFGVVLAREFSGLRHDSGDPIKFGEKAIAHYEKLGIDPRTKSIVFSDGLDVPTAVQIFDHFTGRIGLAFGIGTNLTNSVGLDPLNIVIKLVGCNGLDVVKLSDNPGKEMGNPEVVEEVKKAYKVEQ